jgi:hypothetical protein
MTPEKHREKPTRQEIVSNRLRKLAKLADLDNGYLKVLADRLDVHQTTISAWIAQGYVPVFQVRKLQRRFGKRCAPLDELCPEEFRSV